jgi:hypothetical protein
MTPRIPENISTWLVDWRLVTIVENVPPRDPNDDDEHHEVEIGALLSSREREYERAL